MQIKYFLFALVIAAASSAALAQEVMTGSFRMNQTPTDVFGAETAASISSVVGVDEELQWQVFVPGNYDRGRPPGIFVFVDPDGWGGMPDQYRLLFTNRNMIWIGASSNERNPGAAKTKLQALMAERLIDQNYAVNLNRLYIGSVGDGALTSVNVLLGANQYNGAIYINGSVYWSGGKPENLGDLARKHHAFIIGTGDDRWQSVRKDYDNYKKDGLENVKLFYRPGKINKWPEVEQMDEALAYLDSVNR